MFLTSFRHRPGPPFAAKPFQIQLWLGIAAGLYVFVIVIVKNRAGFSRSGARLVIISRKQSR